MDKPNLHILPGIYSEFRTGAPFRSAFRITSGHINDTYHIITENPSLSYILQRINSSVFKDIPGLMKNIGIVTRHLENKIISGDPGAGSFSVLKLIQGVAGASIISSKERKAMMLLKARNWPIKAAGHSDNFSTWLPTFHRKSWEKRSPFSMILKSGSELFRRRFPGIRKNVSKIFPAKLNLLKKVKKE